MERTLVVFVAHPDDETFGCGALIAGAAAAGARVIVCCASRGELGEDVSGRYPSPGLLGEAREAELHAAAEVLGVSAVELLDLSDSGWDGPAAPGSIVAEPERLAQLMAEVMTRYRPDIVVALDPTGSDGHRDHAAVGRAGIAAFDAVVTWPATLYQWCLPRSLMTAWTREIAAQNPGSVYLETELGRPDAEVTTVIDGAAVLGTVRRAIDQHSTQASPYDGISADLAAHFISSEHLVRIRPPWVGEPRETDLRWPDRATTD